MRLTVVISFLGRLLMIIGASMFFPMFWSLFYREGQWLAFVIAAFLTLLVGGLMVILVRYQGGIRHREGFAIVSFGWLMASFFGSLPYLLTGTFTRFSDAFFETMSGFTTTGASVLTEIEAVSQGILFWRSLTHWLGGMGIVVLFVAVLSLLGTGAMQMFKAEVPGPVAEKIKPRIRETAKILWLTYLLLTLSEILLLWLAGMNLFDAITHTFGTLATGGFSTKNASIGAYDNPAIHWIIIVFMYLAGANFALYYQTIRAKNLKFFWKNEEFILYTAIIIAASGVIFGNLKISNLDSNLTAVVFQVVSIVTTTGYATVDYELWPFLSKALLVALMFVGGCAGSTGGAIKVGRQLTLIKHAAIEFNRLIHPRAVIPLKINQKEVPTDIILNILQFFFLYMLIMVVGLLALTASGQDFVTSFTAVAATLGNVGPGLGTIGPVENYAHFPGWIKIFLSLLMLVGRLEIYTVLILLLPATWRK